MVNNHQWEHTDAPWGEPIMKCIRCMLIHFYGAPSEGLRACVEVDVSVVEHWHELQPGETLRLTTGE